MATGSDTLVASGPALPLLLPVVIAICSNRRRGLFGLGFRADRYIVFRKCASLAGVSPRSLRLRQSIGLRDLMALMHCMNAHEYTSAALTAIGSITLEAVMGSF